MLLGVIKAFYLSKDLKASFTFATLWDNVSDKAVVEWRHNFLLLSGNEMPDDRNDLAGVVVWNGRRPTGTNTKSSNHNIQAYERIPGLDRGVQ